MIEVSCAIIVKNGKILVAQNGANSDQAGKWEFPGGKIKPNETAVKCVVREIKEELEILIRVLDSLHPLVYDYAHKSIRLIPFVCTIESGNIHLHDHQQVKWVEMNELETIDFSAADAAMLLVPGNAELLEKYTRK